MASPRAIVLALVLLTRGATSIRSLEFHYTGLEPDARESVDEIFFRLIQNGASMIERWTIQLNQKLRSGGE